MINPIVRVTRVFGDGHFIGMDVNMDHVVYAEYVKGERCFLWHFDDNTVMKVRESFSEAAGMHMDC